MKKIKSTSMSSAKRVYLDYRIPKNSGRVSLPLPLKIKKTDGKVSLF